jgi:hypothetical protein
VYIFILSGRQGRASRLTITINRRDQFRFLEAPEIPGTIAIECKARVTGEMPVDLPHYWHLQVRRAGVRLDNGQAVVAFDHEYRQQPMRVARGEQILPTFSERVELPAGLYVVYVEVACYPPGDPDPFGRPLKAATGSSKLFRVL